MSSDSILVPMNLGLPSSSSSQTPLMDASTTLAAFLQSSLTLLYKYASKKHEQLRQQCVEVLSKIKSDEKMRAEKAVKGQLMPPDTDANKYFLPLKLACDTGQAKLVAIALDTMEKLIAYGYLDGNCPAPEEIYPTKKKDQPSNGTPDPHAAMPPYSAAPPHAATTPAPVNANGSAPTASASASAASSSVDPSKRKLISVMIETLYECSMFKNPQVQCQVIKALLTTVSSVSCPVHDHGLLQAVTSCYQIYLQAGDETNRTTSKAALTQIFNIVFQRMEHFAAQLRELDETSRMQRDQDKAVAAAAAAAASNKSNGSIESPLASENLPEPSTAAPSGQSSDATVEPSMDSEFSTSSLHLDIDTETKPFEPSLVDESDSGEATSSTPNSSHSANGFRPSPALTPRPPPGKRGYCIVCAKPANHQCMLTRDPVCDMRCKLLNLNKKDPHRVAALSVKTKIQNKLQVLQNDAYYLLRALIKLAHKVLTVPIEQAAVDSKLLSLTLLLSVMQNAGPTFTTNKSFIQLVKVDLVHALLRNSAASNIDTIFALTSNIFIAMLTHFKPHLHKVIGSMLDSIYIPYIQSTNASFEHKLTSLQVVKSVCENPQLIVECFLNYDCDLASFSTFQKIAEVLEKTTHRRQTDTPYDAESIRIDQEERRLRHVALESLVGCMNSLASWTFRMMKPNAQTMMELETAMEHANATSGGRTTALAAIGAAAAAAAMNANADGDTKPVRSPSLVDESSLPIPSSNLLPSPSPPAPISTGATLASSFTTQFQFLRAQKQKLETGVTKFNVKPKVGIAYLQQHGLLGETPEEIATFFHSNSGLDKIQLGDYMGEEGDYNKRVMYAYVEKMDFRGMTFDDSIRAFVQGFRLPGEAQKIDRMMEKFAEQFHKHNPGKFHSADTAYVLAYSIILLNTDAHNPGIKRRMTKQDFFKNCRGIDDGKDIDPVFLGDIYDRITQNEIKMKDDPLVANSSDAGAKARFQEAPIDTKKRFSAFVKESQQMVRRTQELIKTKVVVNPKVGNKLSANEKKALEEISKDELDQPEKAENTTANGGRHEVPSSTNGATSSNGVDGSSSETPAATDENGSATHTRRSSLTEVQEKVFYQATDADAEAIRPMFEILCFPSLATFSVLLEESEMSEVIRLCLNGYRSSIRIANALEMQTARLAFVTSLRKFTLLGSSTKEMKQKNIEAISALLGLAATAHDGNHLHENWFEILQCISEVERLHLIANNSLRGREANFSQELVSGPQSSTSTPIPGGRKEMEAFNSLQVHMIDASAIDRVFAASAHLDGEGIIDFVNALRRVSELELSNIQSPRVFCLQKMVETTYLNMNRIRVVWNRIWSLLSDYFQRAGCHPHFNVSMYAIDSLRQLAMKFLDLKELASYQFQKQFFKPFEFIMIHNPNAEIRELVLECISRMITSKVNNIRSGWKGVFLVLTVAATTSNAAASSAVSATPASHGRVAAPTSLLQLSFSILSTIMENHFTLINDTGLGLETMDECVNCLVTFGCNQQHQDIALKSIQYLVKCADTLTRETKDQKDQPQSSATNGNGSAVEMTPPSTPARTPAAGSVPTSISTSNDTPSHRRRGSSGFSNSATVDSQLRVWFLVLTGLSRMISDSRTEVRTLALHTLFGILNTHGHVFSVSTWRAVFHGVLFPIFDDIRYANEKPANVSYERRKSREHIEIERGEKSTLWKDPTGGKSEEPLAAAANTHTPPNSAPRKPSLSQKSTAAPSTPQQLPRPNGASHTPTPSTTTVTAAAPPSHSRRNSTNVSLTAQFDHSWLQTTCFTALSSLVDLYARFYSQLHFLLPQLLRLIHSCIGQDHAEDLARIGVRCFVSLIQKIGAHLSIGDWWIVLELSSATMEKIQPRVLVSNKLRDHFMIPHLATNLTVYQPFLARASTANATNGTAPTATSTPVTSVVVNPVPIDPSLPSNGSVTVNVTASHSETPSTPASPSSHSRASSSTPPGVSLTLPFNAPPTLTRIKVHLWLLEAISQLTIAFFPTKQIAIQQVRENRIEEELSDTSTGVDVPSAASPTASSLFDHSDPRLIGSMTPSQALYSIDLIGECMNFAHVFNVDITLRRKLHAAGLHIPIPHPMPQQQQPTPPIVQPTNSASTTAASSNVHATTNLPQSTPHLHTTLSVPPPTASAGPSKPARLPQLFYHEAHATRLAIDAMFKLMTEGHQTQTTPSQLWIDEVNQSLDTKSEEKPIDGASLTDIATDQPTAAAAAAVVVSVDVSSDASSASRPILTVCEQRLFALCHSVVTEYINKTQAGQLVSLESQDEVLASVINNFAALPPTLFMKYLTQFYQPFTSLIEYAAQPAIRQALRMLFSNNIATLIKMTQPPADGTL